MRFLDLVATSSSVAESSGRLDKIERLAHLLQALAPAEIEPAVAYLSGSIRQGRTGIGHAAVSAAMDAPAADAATLEILEVDAVFSTMAALSGPGSAGRRADAIRALLSRATTAERHFLARLISGDLRQGALEGVMTDAVARASGIAAPAVRRAAMIAGDLPGVARLALTAGASVLEGLAIQLMSPIRPMLADSADSVEDGLHVVETTEATGIHGGALLDYKIDGARVQAHKDGDDVRLFSRTLKDVTASAPDIVQRVRSLPIRTAIFDGEVIALRPDGHPHPFQETMRRFGRTRNVAGEQAERPLTPFFFDVLYADGASLIDEPLDRRAAVLSEIAADAAIPRVVRPTADEAQLFAANAVAHGHEGVMVKALSAAYAAGRRGSSWLKVKQARTLDLVVLAAEQGHGRRKGWLSNLHLGARDPVNGGFVMLGKTFKGMTDQMLAWQTEKLLALEIGREGITVHVRPELVVEIAFNEIQVSRTYPGGLALRFARVVRYRSDKTAAEADTIETVRALA